MKGTERETDFDLTDGVPCPVCDAIGGWQEGGERVLCSYCVGNGLVSKKDGADLNRYRHRLRRLNDGEIPF